MLKYFYSIMCQKQTDDDIMRFEHWNKHVNPMR
jgi:hypothetical protein